MQNKISTIIFDYGGVIEISEINLDSEISGIAGIPRDKWRSGYLNHNHLTNVENREWKDVVLEVAQKLGASEEQLSKISNLIDVWKNNKKINLELLDLIRRLKDLGFKIAVLSNYTSRLREKIAQQNIENLFDEIIVSGEEGYQKPDKRLFEVAFRKLGVSSENCVFIDDSQSSLQSAQELGYKPILYKNNESLKSSLSQILEIELL